MKTIIRALRNPLFYLIILSLGVYFFFRFTNLPERTIFDWDQESYAKQVRTIIQEGDLTLLGPRVVSDFGFFLGPYFIYLLVPFYLITQLHPSAILIFIVAYNLLFPFAALYLLNKIFKWKVAGLFLLLWGVNSSMIVYDTILWNPVFIPIGVIGTLFLLEKIWKKPHALKYWILLGLLQGLGMNIHFQYAFIVFFTAVFLFFICKKNIIGFIKEWSVMIAAALATYLPLLLFDLKNNFLNSRLFLNFFLSPSASGLDKDIFAWVPVFANFFKTFTYTNAPIAGIIFYILTAGIIFLLIRSKKGFSQIFYISFAAIWLLVPIGFGIYGQRPSEYYFIFLLPFVYLAIIDLLLSKKLLILLALLIFSQSLINVPEATKILKGYPYSYAAKMRTVKYIKEHYDPKTFAISFDVELGREPGFRYMLEHYGIQTHDKADPKLPLIEIQIPPKEGAVTVTKEIGLKVNPKVKENGK